MTYLFSMRRLVLPVIVSLAACGDAATGKIAAPDSILGIYVLESAANQSLPATTIEENGYRLEIVGGTYALASNGTFASSLTIRETIATNAAPHVTTYDERASGVYQVTAQIVRFTDEQGREAIGQLSPGSLSFAGALPRTYRK